MPITRDVFPDVRTVASLARYDLKAAAAMPEQRDYPAALTDTFNAMYVFTLEQFQLDFSGRDSAWAGEGAIKIYAYKWVVDDGHAALNHAGQSHRLHRGLQLQSGNTAHAEQDYTPFALVEYGTGMDFLILGLAAADNNTYRVASWQVAVKGTVSNTSRAASNENVSFTITANKDDLIWPGSRLPSEYTAWREGPGDYYALSNPDTLESLTWDIGRQALVLHQERSVFPLQSTGKALVSAQSPWGIHAPLRPKEAEAVGDNVFNPPITRNVPLPAQRLRGLSRPNEAIASVLLYIDPVKPSVTAMITEAGGLQYDSVLGRGEESGLGEGTGTALLLSPGRTSTFFLLGSTAAINILELYLDSATRQWAIRQAKATQFDFNTVPRLWGRWFPTLGAFYQNRLWLSGHPDWPGRIWASQTLTFGGSERTPELISFAFSTDSRSAIDVSVPGDGRVSWLHAAHNRLLVGTTRGEYVMAGSTEGPLTNLNASLAPQSYHGSESSITVDAADQFLWLDRSKTVRGTSYLESSQSYVSAPLTAHGLWGEDINAEVCLHRAPDMDMLIVTGGQITKLGTFKTEIGRIGWGSMTMYGWTVINAVSVPDAVTGLDRLYFLTVNESDYSEIRLLEYSASVYMDNWIGTRFTGDTVSFDLISHQDPIAAQDGVSVPLNKGSAPGTYSPAAGVSLAGEAGIKVGSPVRIGDPFISHVLGLPLVFASRDGTNLDLKSKLARPSVSVRNSPAPDSFREGAIVEGDKSEIKDSYSIEPTPVRDTTRFQVLRIGPEALTITAFTGTMPVGKTATAA